MTETTKNTLALVAVALLGTSLVGFANCRDSEALKDTQPRIEAKAKVEQLRKDFKAGRIGQDEYTAQYNATLNALPEGLRHGGL